MQNTTGTTGRSDLRTIYPHGSWQDVYRLLDCPISIEPGAESPTEVSA